MGIPNLGQVFLDVRSEKLISILRRLLHTVDDENFQGPGGRFQPQTYLFLDSREDC